MFSLLRQWSYVHEHRELPKRNDVLLIRSQLPLPTGIADSLKTRKNFRTLICLLSLCITILGEITNLGERVIPLLNGNRQKLHLSSKYKVPASTAGMAGVYEGSVHDSQGQLKISDLPFKLERQSGNLWPNQKLTTCRPHSLGRDLSFLSFTETSHVTKSALS